MKKPFSQPAGGLSAPNSPFRGRFERLVNGAAQGWAADLRPQAQPVRLHVLIDQQEIMQIVCDQPRADVQAALNLPSDLLGFQFTIPDAFHDAKPHDVSIRFADRTILPFVDLAEPGGTAERALFPGVVLPEYQSFVDGVKRGALRGWVIRRPSPHSAWEGRCVIAVTLNNVKIVQCRADRYRGDVAALLSCDPNCGFEIPLPQHLRGNSLHTFHVTVLPDGTELEGSPLKTSLADDQLEARLIDLASTIDDLQRRLTTLRLEVRDLIPKRGHTLDDYDRWARAYYSRLSRKVADQRRRFPLAREPLVSVLCPAWRPLMEDFRAAIGSVLAQTYRNWELIIIDDAGDSAEITQAIEAFCRQDERIRVITLARNLGISGATNAGIDAARGDYIVFFDHDDLLVDVALEVMIRDALSTGAKLLYSDEDKIDQAGHYLEPNLKPDYNYRYLLGCNYICHLTMVEAQSLHRIGPLNSRYDGAQDHDFILRATETLAAGEIHHVREILYHWRKTPNSTAVNVTNKSYAITAGIACVSDHLKRRGLKARISSLNGLSIYEVDWLTRKRPSVTIIIPFKDQADMTRRCVTALLDKLAYKNFDLLLVDNWSVEKETRSFIDAIEKHPKVSVLTVEEAFNYARLNNLAAQKTTADYLLFLNNDVTVEQSDFLTLLMGEALSSPTIGAVGAKLLYPNDTIQHAGVAVGPAGIGAHVHRGLPHDDDSYGYIGRAKLTHEVTAVTAAAMLVRADLFRDIGGFDENELPIAYNDVDLCLKIRQAGYRIIFCAQAVAHHHESLSRGTDDRLEHESRFFQETQTMLARWRGTPLFESDPAYPHYFTVDQQPFFDLRDPEDLC